MIVRVECYSGYKAGAGQTWQVCQSRIVSTEGVTSSMCAKCVPAPQKSAFFERLQSL